MIPKRFSIWYQCLVLTVFRHWDNLCWSPPPWSHVSVTMCESPGVTWPGPEPAIVSPALCARDNVNEDTCSKGAIKIWKIEKVYSWRNAFKWFLRWFEMRLKSWPGNLSFGCRFTSKMSSYSCSKLFRCEKNLKILWNNVNMRDKTGKVRLQFI